MGGIKNALILIILILIFHYVLIIISENTYGNDNTYSKQIVNIDEEKKESQDLQINTIEPITSQPPITERIQSDNELPIQSNVKEIDFETLERYAKAGDKLSGQQDIKRTRPHHNKYETIKMYQNEREMCGAEDSHTSAHGLYPFDGLYDLEPSIYQKN